MTELDAVAGRILTVAVSGEAVVTDALHQALRRDLGRLIAVLTDPVTVVRRGALIGHISYLLQELQAHHRVLDEIRWLDVVAVRPDLADVAYQVALSHDELASPLRSLRNCTLAWRSDSKRRLEVRSAVQDFSAAASAVLDQDSELAPVIDEVLGAAPAPQWWKSAPTRLARRTFWLLDDLDTGRADLLADRTPRAVMWVLRNGFSGAYNRSAYLMWAGGGTGPAV